MKNEIEIAEVVLSVLKESGGRRVALAELPSEVLSAIEELPENLGIEVLKPPYDNSQLWTRLMAQK